MNSNHPLINEANGFLRATALIFLLLLIIPPCKANTPQGYRITTVVIDAGHGGKDPGAIGKSCYEKNIALGIALKLGQYIEKYLPDISVIYTRKTDIFIPLHQRADIANKKNADLFISIHANSIKKSSIRGTETYTLGLHKTKENLEVAMKENAVMLYEEDYSTRYEGFDPKNPASYIIFNLIQGNNREKSIDLAELTEFQFKTRAGRHSRGVRQAGFLVLKQASMPSILVEAGFVSNPQEEKYLKSKKGQEYIASAIFRAFRDYKKKIENKSTLIVNNLPKEQITPPLSSDATTEIPTNNSSPVQFCVQVSSSVTPIPKDSPRFKNLGNIAEYKISGRYKYTVGATSQYDQILKTQKKVKKVVKDCFVIALINGKPIPLWKARKLMKQKNTNRQ